MVPHLVAASFSAVVTSVLVVLVELTRYWGNFGLPAAFSQTTSTYPGVGDGDELDVGAVDDACSVREPESTTGDVEDASGAVAGLTSAGDASDGEAVSVLRAEDGSVESVESEVAFSAIACVSAHGALSVSAANAAVGAPISVSAAMAAMMIFFTMCSSLVWVVLLGEPCEHGPLVRLPMLSQLG